MVFQNHFYAYYCLYFLHILLENSVGASMRSMFPFQKLIGKPLFLAKILTFVKLAHY